MMGERTYNKEKNGWFHEEPNSNDSYETTFGSLENVSFGFCDYALNDLYGRK